MIQADSMTGRIIGALAREGARKPEPLFHVDGPPWLVRILAAAGAQVRHDEAGEEEW